MSNFREMRACVEIAYESRFINEQEFVLLCDAYKSTNPDFPNWNYETFDLDVKTNDECKAEFRFDRKDIYKLADQLQLPDEKQKKRHKVKNINVKNIFLMQFLNYLAKPPEVSRENFENSPHIPLYLRRRQFTLNSVVDAGNCPQRHAQ